jgi:flagellar hook-basal body complex protein FliE
MPVSAIGSLSDVLAAKGVTGTTATSLPAIGSGAAATTGTSATTFATSLASAIDGLSGAQAHAGDLAVQAVTGQLDDIHDYTIAATEAQVALELTAAIRNKAVEAFTEIMRMQA